MNRPLNDTYELRYSTSPIEPIEFGYLFYIHISYNFLVTCQIIPINTALLSLYPKSLPFGAITTVEKFNDRAILPRISPSMPPYPPESFKMFIKYDVKNTSGISSGIRAVGYRGNIEIFSGYSFKLSNFRNR